MADLLELGCIQFIHRDEKPDFLVGRVFAFASRLRVTATIREEGPTA
ncbi:MAG: hypothetical protein BMS9Abin28_0171 [Anaerolineae bacterium]|nr:MAG: hypothetical protein BMS9Abin28_0171 [Anaerolineae bacterium]